MKTDGSQAGVDMPGAGLFCPEGRHPQTNIRPRMSGTTEWLVIRLSLLLAVGTLLALSTVTGDIRLAPWLIVAVPVACVSVSRFIDRDAVGWDHVGGFLIGGMSCLIAVLISEGFGGSFWWMVGGLGAILC